ncbi:MAG: DUF3995 domain-containing protein [Dermatophilaceae bacterium]
MPLGGDRDSLIGSGWAQGDTGCQQVIALSESEVVTRRRSDATSAVGVGALLVAGALGAIHAGFSLYWAAGGHWLIWSLGSDLVDSFQGREWLLVPIGGVKLIATVSPIVLARRGWPARAFTRAACWVGALALVGWGGLNTVVANLVLAGVIQPGSGYDRPGMVGHAYLWDPLFLAWGAALTVGLASAHVGWPRRPHAERGKQRPGPLDATTEATRRDDRGHSTRRPRPLDSTTEATRLGG